VLPELCVFGALQDATERGGGDPHLDVVLPADERATQSVCPITHLLQVLLQLWGDLPKKRQILQGQLEVDVRPFNKGERKVEALSESGAACSARSSSR
jgi:hypothetical protein